MAFAIHGLVVLPRLTAVAVGWNHRDEAEIQRQSPGLLVFVGAIHNQMQRRRRRTDAAQKFAPRDRVGSLARREREGYGSSRIRGNDMNLGGSSAARFSDGLGTVF